MKKNRPNTPLLILAIIISTPLLARALDYAEKGPLTFTTASLPADISDANAGFVVVPDSEGPFPLIVDCHGWSADAGNQVGWAEHFASWGFVAVVPTFPDALSPDHQQNRQIIEDLVSVYTGPDGGYPGQDKIDADLVGLQGHSAGGLAATLAAAEIQPDATVLFDPVDSNDLGMAALPEVCGPVMEIFSNPSSCNSDGNWVPFKTSSSGPIIALNVVNSTHCDGELPARPACALVCGGAADAERQKEFARYATAFFLYHLNGDPDAGSQLTEQAMAANTAIADVVVEDAEDCTEEVDAGADSDVDSDSDSDADADSGTGDDDDSGGDDDDDNDDDDDDDDDNNDVSDGEDDDDSGGDDDGSDDGACGCGAVGGVERFGFLIRLFEIL